MTAIGRKRTLNLNTSIKLSERVQKYLANRGVGSRREIERWIQAGEILIDGEICVLGQRISGDEKIVIRDELVNLGGDLKTRVLLYHKPCGEIVTRSDPEQRPTVFNSLPKLKSGRWVSVGRLDINTSGLLLMTTDGGLANAMMHPRNEIEREYRVRIHGEVTDEKLTRLQQGVQLEDGVAKITIIEAQEGRGTNTWYRIILKEGRNREVRRIWESQGLQVSRLIRTRFGTTILPRDLREGKYIELSTSKVHQLQKLSKLD